jgi:hypothetical protein
MSPQEVRSLMEGVIDARLLPQWYVIGLSLFGAALLGGLIAWGSSYLQVKAQNFAKKEDFDELKRQLQETTRLTEAIKSDVSGSLWERQERFRTKFRLYEQLIVTLADIASRFTQLDFLTEKARDPKFAHLREETERFTDEYMSKLKAQMDTLRAAQSVAPLILHGETLEALDSLVESWREGEFQSDFYKQTRVAVVKALTKVVFAARQDVKLDSGETA